MEKTVNRTAVLYGTKKSRDLKRIIVQYFKVVERDRGSNPTARPRGRPDAFEARFFCMLLLIQSQHSGSGPLIWASRALGCPQGALCGGKFQCRLRVLRPRSVGNRANKS